jgi:drug/metabolite transporter (DMT)-like permease
MLAAVAAGALGYAEGGRLAARLGGWQTIAWALVAAAPWLLAPALWSAAQQPLAHAGVRAWAGLAYVSVFSQFAGFLFWYGGMAIAGVARVSQVQLLQLFVTLAIAAAWMGETVEPRTWAVAAAVVVLVAAGRYAPVRRAPSLREIR